MTELSQITDEEVPRRIADEEEYYKIIGETIVNQSKIDVNEYEANLSEIGRQIMATSGGPLSAPAQQAYDEIDESIAEEKILPLIDEELIQEHRENPIGAHSNDLERVLNYFRRHPSMDNTYVILETEKIETFYIGKLTGNRGDKPEKLDDPLSSIDEAEYLPYPLTSVEQAEHGVFLKRVDDLRSEFSN
jgi:hypothetical protein